MEKPVVIYPSKLKGEITIKGAKNAVLRHLAASILTDGIVRITNYPNNMLDVIVHEEMLECLGKTITKHDGMVEISGQVSTSELIWDKR